MGLGLLLTSFFFFFYFLTHQFSHSFFFSHSVFLTQLFTSLQYNLLWNSKPVANPFCGYLKPNPVLVCWRGSIYSLVKLVLCGHWMHLSCMHQWCQRTNFTAPGCRQQSPYKKNDQVHSLSTTSKSPQFWFLQSISATCKTIVDRGTRSLSY